MRHLFAGLKGFIWGTMLFLHLSLFVALISTLYLSAPTLQESTREISKLTKTFQQFAAIRKGEIPDVELDEIATPEELERQYNSIKQTGKPKPNAFMWRTTAWSLLISVTLGSGILILSWWRVKSRGPFRYLLALGLIGPYSVGSLTFAAHIIKSLPESARPFPPTLEGLYFFNEEPLSYLLQIPVVLFIVALPAWVAFARSRSINFASILFPRQR